MPATVRKIHRELSFVVASAVKDGRLVRNPADGVNLPRVPQGERRYLTHDLLRRRAEIVESVTVVRGVQTWGTPKGHERRSVPIPRFLVNDLAGARR